MSPQEQNKDACARYRAKNLEKRRADTAERMRRARLESPEKVKAVNDRYRKNNPEKINAAERARYARDPLKKLASIARYRQQNPGKAEAAIASWVKRNPAKVSRYGARYLSTEHGRAKHCSNVARRNARKRRATVAWANHEAIGAIYAEAARLTRETGIPQEVDHVVPLIHNLICGLHVEGNLQILTARDNRRKRNKWPL